MSLDGGASLDELTWLDTLFAVEDSLLVAPGAVTEDWALDDDRTLDERTLEDCALEDKVLCEDAAGADDRFPPTDERLDASELTDEDVLSRLELLDTTMADELDKTGVDEVLVFPVPPSSVPDPPQEANRAARPTCTAVQAKRFFIFMGSPVDDALLH